MLICLVVGARPNFMKIAPVVRELERRDIPHILVHTGQHYDKNMSQVFFDDLGLPKPDIYLGVGSDSHAKQTARIMSEFDDIVAKQRPDLLIVSGDVNSTLATALVASKLHIPIAHIESGLRSFDREMPEEVNRVLTDHLSELLFTTENSGNVNLKKEGIDDSKVHFVGSCMVDTLLNYADTAVARKPWEDLGLKPKEYALMTLHRPSNVDNRESLRNLIETINELSQQYVPMIFPVHPRTRQRLEDWDIPIADTLRLEAPMPYINFVGMISQAKYVLTDSGGIQEETTMLGVPCLTLRWNAEHLATFEVGMNRLVGTDSEKIKAGVADVFNGSWQTGGRPSKWDGQASKRIIDVVEAWMKTKAE